MKNKNKVFATTIPKTLKEFILIKIKTSVKTKSVIYDLVGVNLTLQIFHLVFSLCCALISLIVVRCSLMVCLCFRCVTLFTIHFIYKLFPILVNISYPLCMCVRRVFDSDEDHLPVNVQ